jgi:hypothetical protein
MLTESRALGRRIKFDTLDVRSIYRPDFGLVRAMAESGELDRSQDPIKLLCSKEEGRVEEGESGVGSPSPARSIVHRGGLSVVVNGVDDVAGARDDKGDEGHEEEDEGREEPGLDPGQPTLRIRDAG